MSDENPFTPPEAQLKRALPGALVLRQEPLSVPAAHGLQWVKQGFGLFKMSPINWIVMALLFGLLMVVLSTIPLLSILTNLISPVFAGGLLLACRDLERGQRINVNYLYAAVRTHLHKLVIVGVLYGLGTLLVFVVGSMFMGGALMGSAAPVAEGAAPVLDTANLGMFALIMLILLVPLMMAYVFAPALIVFHDLAPIDAMKLSYRACLRNLGSMAVFGLLALLLGIAAAIPMALGFLVWIPVMMGAVYSAYRDILVN